MTLASGSLARSRDDGKSGEIDDSSVGSGSGFLQFILLDLARTLASGKRFRGARWMRNLQKQEYF